MRVPFNGSFPINQYFNDPRYRQTYIDKFGMLGHNGIDYDLPAWTPVVAAHSGTVVSGWDEGGYGYFIFITGGGYESVYGHLARISRASGPVNEGEVIGYSGTTGFSSGPHLHWGVRPIPYNRNNGFFGYIDPLPLLTATNQDTLTMTPEVRAVLEDLKANILDGRKEISALRRDLTELQQAVYGRNGQVAQIPLTSRVEDVKQHVINVEGKV